MRAIVDIGSNAIRAAVYDTNTLGASEVYSNKFKINIQRLLDSDDFDVTHHFYLTIWYFNDIFKRYNAESIKCVATALIRNSPNSTKFCDYIRNQYGWDIEIIPGEEEARLTAIGAIMGELSASGIVADLGGGSLELASVSNGSIDECASLQIGHKLATNRTITYGAFSSMLAKRIPSRKIDTLYLVGGGFRMIGKCYMSEISYPLKTLHRLNIPNSDLKKYLQSIGTKLTHKYSSIPIDEHTYNVLNILIEYFAPSKVVISNYGLKEGVRFSLLPDDERKKDFLIERCKRITCFNEANMQNILLYRDMIAKFLISNDQDTLNAITVALMFANTNESIDFTLRWGHIAQFILLSDMPLTHKQRVVIANAILMVSNNRMAGSIKPIVNKILDQRDYVDASIIGHLLSVIYQVEGFAMFAPPSFSITRNANSQILINAGKVLPHEVFIFVKNALKSIHKLQIYQKD